MPVYRNGEVIRTLYARVGLEEFSKLMEELRYGKTGRAFILDSRGICAAHLHENMILRDYTKPSADGVITKEISKAAKRMLEKKIGIEYYEYRGEDWVLAYCPVPNTDWIVVTAAGKNEVLGAAQQFKI